jgi:competence protein ComEA
MSFYRTFFASIAVIAITSPVFADNASINNNTAKTTAATTSIGQNTSSKLNINATSAKELSKVKGLNASKAKSIVAYRKKHGNFQSLDDLAKVRSIKKMKTEDVKTIQDQLTI